MKYFIIFYSFEYIEEEEKNYIGKGIFAIFFIFSKYLGCFGHLKEFSGFNLRPLQSAALAYYHVFTTIILPEIVINTKKYDIIYNKPSVQAEGAD